MYKHIYIYIYVYAFVCTYALSKFRDSSCQLPDGVRTTGSSQKCRNFPNQLSTCGQHVATYSNTWQTITYGNTCALETKYVNANGICGPSVNTPLVPTTSGSGWVLTFCILTGSTQSGCYH